MNGIIRDAHVLSLSGILRLRIQTRPRKYYSRFMRLERRDMRNRRRTLFL